MNFTTNLLLWKLKRPVKRKRRRARVAGGLPVLLTVEHEGVGDGQQRAVPHARKVRAREGEVRGKLRYKLVHAVQEQEEHGAQRGRRGGGGQGVVEAEGVAEADPVTEDDQLEPLPGSELVSE